MKVKKDTILKINHNRKGVFLAKAIKDFDTEEEFYPVVLISKKVDGLGTIWEKGEEIPCRSSLCKIEVTK